MKLKVYGEKEEDMVVRLKLEQDIWGINVVAVDGNGKEIPGGYLLTFRYDGTIYRSRSLNPLLGFKLNDKYEILLKDGED